MSRATVGRCINKSLCFTLCAMFVAALFSAVTGSHKAYAANPIQQQYYVSPTGSDTNPGTLSQPFATLTKARDAVSAINSAMTGDIIVYLRGGTYVLTSTLQLAPSDSGSNGFNVIYEAYPGEVPEVSGGVAITNWSLYDASKNIYRAAATSLASRQLYVNGKMATRARSTPAPAGFTVTSTGYTTPSSGFYANMSNWGTATSRSKIEMVYVGYPWMYSHCSVDNISGTTITMKQPCWNNSSQQRNGASYIENAYELLDAAGEWYLDEDAGYVYYIPTPDVNLSTAQVIIPAIETLLDLTGTSSAPVHNIQFNQITFEYATWLGTRSNIGYASAQGGQIIDSASPFDVTNPSPGNVQLTNANNIVFQNGVFRYLGGIALYVTPGGSNNISVVGNAFYDNSHSGIVSGKWDHTQTAPTNTNFTIKDNFFARMGTEFIDAVPMFLSNTSGTIDHNEMTDLPYSGITINDDGAWNITNNRIYNYMKRLADGGGIYTNSVNQDTSAVINITNNYVFNQSTVYAGIYLDDFSKDVNAQNNVVSKTPYSFLFKSSNGYHTIANNYIDTGMSNQCGSTCTVSNNTTVTNGAWPADAQNIMYTAGLEPDFWGLRKYAPTNLALSIAPTFSTGGVSRAAAATDGDISNSQNYTDIPAGLQWMQIDLGQAYNISQLKVWHYYFDGRTYHDVIMQLSNDPTFSTGVTTVFNNDTNNSAGLGAGTDAEYAETSAGKVVSVNNVNARYVRYYSNGSTANTSNHYMEVEVYGAIALAPNVALGILPTFSTTNVQRAAAATDGDISNSSNYTNMSDAGPKWMQLDLGQVYVVSRLQVWHYYFDGRTYHDVIMQLSNDPTFSTGVTTVYNNDTDNSTGQGTGTNAEYAETGAGKVVPVNNINARYVRFYSNGSTANVSSHYMEVQVNGVVSGSGTPSTNVFQAESFNSYNSVQIQSGGTGSIVGYIQNGSWMAYNNINFGTGNTQFTANISVWPTYAGNQLQLRLDSPTGTLIGTLTTTSTGNWTTFTNQTCAVSGVSGLHNLYIVASSSAPYVANIDWFQFQ